MSLPAVQDSRREEEFRALMDALAEAPWKFDFFALMRRIECLRPQAPRLGRALRPAQEPLRLGQVADLDFAPAPIVRFERGESAPSRLGVRFFGLLGPNGPMPLHFTEFVRERRHQHADPTAARFLDIFHHRMLSLFYRAWAMTQPTVQLDRPDDDRYAVWLGATFGLGTGTTRRDSVPDAAKLYQAGLIGSRSRHPEAVCKALREYFRVPVSLIEHVAHWMNVAAEDRSRLGHAANRAERRSASGAGARLGMSASAGSKVYDRQFKFRLQIGPVDLANYESFLPGGRSWTELQDWVRLLAGADLQWEARLGLRLLEVPAPRLGRHVRLGQTCWLARSTDTVDRWDLTLRPRPFLSLHPSGAAHG